jgi:F-box and WD-40 domain protein CDC4
LIVTGSRDHTIRVWTLPKPTDAEYRCYGADDAEIDPSEVCVSFSPAFAVVRR